MDFLETLKHYQKIISQALKEYLERKIKGLSVFSNPLIGKQCQLFAAYCLRDGKRLRPTLTLMAYRAVGGRNEKNILLPVLAFELFHNYTLIHDDIYDEDDKRRNEWANHILLQRWYEKRYGESSSENILYKNNAARFGVVAGIINGKYLHTLSGSAILESDIPDAKKIAGLKLHREVSNFDNTGQTIDLYFEQENGIKEKDYNNMVLCKTGRLFKAAIEWGAILGDASESQKNALAHYMEETAVVFQIQDDILDISFGSDKGRGFGSDIRKGKKTLLMIHALEKADASQQRKILRVLGNTEASETEIKEVIALLEELGSVDYCRRVANRRIKKAIKYLDGARPALNGEAKKFFYDMAHFMLERKK